MQRKRPNRCSFAKTKRAVVEHRKKDIALEDIEGLYRVPKTLSFSELR